MNRRRLLAAFAGAGPGLLLAGCSGQGTGAEPTEEPGVDASPGTEDTPTTVAPGPSSTRTDRGSDTPETDGPTEKTGEAGVAVTLEPLTYVTMIQKQQPGRSFNPDDIVPQDEIPEALRSPLLRARNGGYETDSVSEAFRAAIDEFRKYRNTTFAPYVRLAGTPYEFEPEVPTFVAELADEEASVTDSDAVNGFQVRMPRPDLSGL